MTVELRGDDRAFLRAPRAKPSRVERVISAVDLFSGCGGMALGVQEAARSRAAALDIRLAVELDPEVAAVYARNFAVPPDRLRADVRRCFDRAPGRPLSTHERDARALVHDGLPTGLDLLVGGPPCQGHSTLNNHTRGDDPKNRLYLAMVRAAEVLAPRVVLVENVPAVERDRGRVVDRATAMLRSMGYGVDSAIVSVAELGVPQLRNRHVLVAVRNGMPEISAAIGAARCRRVRNLAWAIRDLASRYGKSAFDTSAAMTEENLARARFLLRTKRFDLPNHLRPTCQRGAHKYKSMYGRLRWDAPAQTITTGFGSPGQGRYLHPDQPRTLTPHEAARVQFFPDWFDFGTLRRRALARAIGNAVPPKLAFALAVHFIGACSKASRRASRQRVRVDDSALVA